MHLTSFRHVEAQQAASQWAQVDRPLGGQVTKTFHALLSVTSSHLRGSGEAGKRDRTAREADGAFAIKHRPQMRKQVGPHVPPQPPNTHGQEGFRYKLGGEVQWKGVCAD